MPTNEVTTNRSYEKPALGNTETYDIVRLRNALDAIDTDVNTLATNAAGVFNSSATFDASGVGTLGRLLVGAGSVGAPSISFSTDLDTGFYSPADGNLGISINGTERFRLYGYQILGGNTFAINTGVGTVPSAAIQLNIVGSNGSAFAAVKWNGSGFPFRPPSFSMAVSDGADVNNHAVTASDRLLGRLDWSASDSTAFYAAAGIYGHTDAATSVGSVPGRLSFYTTPSGSVVPSERMRLTSAGSLLIGQTTGTEKLELTGNANITGNVYASGVVDATGRVRALDYIYSNASDARAWSLTSVGDINSWKAHALAAQFSPFGQTGDTLGFAVIRKTGTAGIGNSIRESHTMGIRRVDGVQGRGFVGFGLGHLNATYDSNGLGVVTIGRNNFNRFIFCISRGFEVGVETVAPDTSTDPTWAPAFRAAIDGTVYAKELRLGDDINSTTLDLTQARLTELIALADARESGTFTPTYVPSGGAFTTMTYAAQIGNYVVVDGLCYIELWIKTDNVDLGSATGQLRIGGLPFSAAAGSGRATIMSAEAVNFIGETPLIGETVNGAAQLYLRYRTSAPSNTGLSAPSDLTTGAVADQNSLRLTGFYRIA